MRNADLDDMRDQNYKEMVADEWKEIRAMDEKKPQVSETELLDKLYTEHTFGKGSYGGMQQILNSQTTAEQIYTGIVPILKEFNREVLDRACDAFCLPRTEAITQLAFLKTEALGALSSQPDMSK